MKIKSILLLTFLLCPVTKILAQDVIQNVLAAQYDTDSILMDSLKSVRGEELGKVGEAWKKYEDAYSTYKQALSTFKKDKEIWKDAAGKYYNEDPNVSINEVKRKETQRNKSLQNIEKQIKKCNQPRENWEKAFNELTAPAVPQKIKEDKGDNNNETSENEDETYNKEKDIEIQKRISNSAINPIIPIDSNGLVDEKKDNTDKNEQDKIQAQKEALEIQKMQADLKKLREINNKYISQ